jgi:cardiolipin synthase
MLYDDMGSRTLRKKDLKQFKDKGGHAEAFFPSKLTNLAIYNYNFSMITVIHS